MNECIRAWSTFLVNGFFWLIVAEEKLDSLPTRPEYQTRIFFWFKMISFCFFLVTSELSKDFQVSFKKNFIIIFQSGHLWIFLKWINFLLDHNDDSHTGTFFISQFGPFNTREKKTVGYEYLIIMRGDITKGQILISGECARWFRQQHYGGFFYFFGGGEINFKFKLNFFYCFTKWKTTCAL